MIDFTLAALQNAGLPYRTGGSAIEALEARGLYDVASAEYLKLAHRAALRADRFDHPSASL